MSCNGTIVLHTFGALHCASQRADADRSLGELELELIQSHMAQKPVLRGEVGCACVAREVSAERGGMGERGCARRLGRLVWVRTAPSVAALLAPRNLLRFPSHLLPQSPSRVSALWKLRSFHAEPAIELSG